MRVPNHPPHGPKPVTMISTAQQHLAAGLQVISHCSAYPASHQHVVNLEAVVASGDVELDHAWKRAQRCRECGAPGGGITILRRDADVKSE